MKNNFENKLSLLFSTFNDISMPHGLYIVATPIGNLADISFRSVLVLQKMDAILVEDTRHSGIFLAKLGIKKPLLTIHEHNERHKAQPILQRIIEGESMALICDAGTPLISDPGFHLVREAQSQKIKVIPVPGPSAVVTALSASGLPTDKFIFCGFLPAKKNDRQKVLQTLKQENKTLVFYEAPHRITDTLEDMISIFGPNREAVIARELTKTFENICRYPLQQLLTWVQETNAARGEIVILVAGNSEKRADIESTIDIQQLLTLLLAEVPPTKAASIAAKITGIPKRTLYKMVSDPGI